jgi:hypothetical protein
MIGETLTVKAARKSCQAGHLYSIAAGEKADGEQISGSKTVMEKLSGTKRLNRVSKRPSAQPKVLNGQTWSATPIPFPGENT